MATQSKRVAKQPRRTKRPTKTPTKAEKPLPEGAIEEAARRVIPDITPEQAERAAAFREKSERDYRERRLSALSNLLSGGLTVDTTDGADLPPERALMRVAGALVKAVTIAAFGAGNYNLGSGGWDPDSAELSQEEAIEALTGISALLRDGATLLSHLQSQGDFRSSYERIEAIEEREERLARAAAGVS